MAMFTFSVIMALLVDITAPTFAPMLLYVETVHMTLSSKVPQYHYYAPVDDDSSVDTQTEHDNGPRERGK